jgi:hypothetical protein
MALGLVFRAPAAPKPAPAAPAEPTGQVRPEPKVAVRSATNPEADLYPALRVTASEVLDRLARAHRSADPARERSAALSQLDAAVELALRPPGVEAPGPDASSRALRSLRAGFADASK